MQILPKLRILYLVLWDSIAGGFDYWKIEIWDHDLDERYCCDGKMCMCGGETIRQVWERKPNSKQSGGE